MKLLDKAITAIAPTWGLKRLESRRKHEILNSGGGYGNYGASKSKTSMVGWLTNAGSATEDIDEHAQTLRERNRDAYYGVPIATGALKTMRTNVVGPGIAMKAKIDHVFLNISEEKAREIESCIEREFSLWASSDGCDLERVNNFYGLQQLVFLNWLMSGDVFVLLPTTERVNMPYDLRVQLVEADFVCDPPDKRNRDIVGGVELDRRGEVVAYHIVNKHPLAESNTPSKERWRRVKAFGDITGRPIVIRIGNTERIGQRRGIPFLSPVIEALKLISRYTEAEIMAAVVNGVYAIFIEKEGTSSDPPIGSVIPLEQQIDPGNEKTIEVAPGAIIDLNDGEKMKEFSPGRPNANFDGFVTAILRQIGAALEIPYEVLVHSFNNSYSAARASLLELLKTVKMYRKLFVDSFCQPIYQEWLAEAVAKGRVSAPGFFSDPAIRQAYSIANWYGPSQGSLNPTLDVAASVMKIENGFSTGSQEAQELTGSDYFRNIEQLKQEARLMAELNQIKAGGENKIAETS